jgi:hypothetical protein
MAVTAGKLQSLLQSSNKGHRKGGRSRVAKGDTAVPTSRQSGDQSLTFVMPVAFHRAKSAAIQGA